MLMIPLLLSSLALADGPSRATRVDVEPQQEGPDVRLTLSISDARSEPAEHEVLLVRRGRLREKTLFQGVFGELEDATEAPYCQESYDSEPCNEHDSCQDCDGDGEPECPGFCVARRSVALVDTCPPIGEISYTFLIEGMDTGTAGWSGMPTETATFVVEDVGQRCPGSCGCASSEEAPASLMAALLGLLALVGLRRRAVVGGAGALAPA